MSNAAVFDNKARKEARMENTSGAKELSRSAYNGVLGGTLLFGLLVNVACCTLFRSYIMMIPPLGIIIGFFVIALVSGWVIGKSDNPVVSFIGFTFMSAVTGMLITYAVQYYNAGTVLDAFIVTAIIVAVMVVISTIKPDIFLKMGAVLLIALVLAILVQVVMMFLHVDQTWLDYAVIVIFCGFIGYDWARSQAYAPTVDNAIDSAADIYLDVVNIFLRVLSVMGRK